jgi:uncharacterized protein (TIGR02757 family)
MESLKRQLDRLYIQYKRKFSSKDPVWILHRFDNEKDIEIIGLITSAYAYGQVDLINKFIEKLLSVIDKKPYEFTINFEKRKDKKYLKGLNYRFNTEKDLIELFERLKNVLVSHGSLKHLFLEKYDCEKDNVEHSLFQFMKKLIPSNEQSSPYPPSKGEFNFLIPDPTKKSTCKRMNLFLRWMVRKDEIDAGIWSEVDKSKLIMPVDVHIARIAKKLNLVSRATVDMKFAIELTNKLKEFDNDDPVKYDFSLCHIGIDGKDISD